MIRRSRIINPAAAADLLASLQATAPLSRDRTADRAPRQEQGKRERARRQRQIAKGMLRVAG